MTISIGNAFVEQFKDNVTFLSQQSDARLRPHVREESLTGDQFNIDRIGTTEALTKGARRSATQFVDSPWSRRRSAPITKEWADTIEHDDEVQMLINAQSAYAKSGANAMRRAIDDLIISVATSDTLTEDGTGAAQVFPAGQKLGNGTASMTYSDILSVNKIFNENDVDPSEERVWVLDPGSIKKLMDDDKIINSDYQKLNMLVNNGVVSNLFGGTAIMSNRLLDGAAAASASALNLCFTMDALCLGVNRDMMVRIEERADLSYLTQVYFAWTMAAVRVQDEKIVSFDGLRSGA